MRPRDLSDHEPYEAGRGIAEVARELGRDPTEFVKLASNENPLGPSPAAVEAVRAGADDLHRYPTAAHADLRAELAERWAVPERSVWLAAGADGALDYLSRATLRPGEAVLVPEPGFAYYPMTTRYHHGEVHSYPLSPPAFDSTAEGVLEAYDGERLVYLTSPHNPTGATFSVTEVERIARETDEETLVAVDEAYGEYADRPSAARLVGATPRRLDSPEGPVAGAMGDPVDVDREGREDVAVLRTFSKAFGLAGLRVGYALVPPAWGEAYARVNTPFAVNELACRGALAALDDHDHVRRSVAVARRSRERLLSVPGAVDGEGNFVLVEVGDGRAVAEATKEDGVILRDCASFGLPGYVRVTAGTDTETDRALAAVARARERVQDGPEGSSAAVERSPDGGDTDDEPEGRR
jgi:histidinol-phosphate aminotransferase